MKLSSSIPILHSLAASLVGLVALLTLIQEAVGFKYHDFCLTPPRPMQTRFPLYILDVNTKTNGIPWAYRQNNTITVSVKALYQKYKVKRLFMSVPSMTTATPEVPARKIYLGQWKWQMKGGVIPLDCNAKQPGGKHSLSSPTFSGGANAVRDLWWYKDGFYNVTAEWDPLNTIYNAYKIDMISFEVFVSPDPEPNRIPGGFGPNPENRWVKLNSDKFVNLDYIDLHRYLQVHPHARWVLGGIGS